MIRTAGTHSWSGFVPHPERYRIHRNDGLTHVIRPGRNGGTNRPAASAGSATTGGYAWYAVTCRSS